MNLKQIISILIKNPFLIILLRPPYRIVKNVLNEIYRYVYLKADTNRLKCISRDIKHQKIFYFGITEHSNLGDLAQLYCIRKWINDNFQNIEVYEFEATTVVDTRFNFCDKLYNILNTHDIIIFQSGYCTQDLGGNHELMHRIIIDRFPNAKILMMPQTVYFNSEENKLITSKSYNQNQNMLFLARDRISCEFANNIFPDITVKLFPDIVTSLIGHYRYNYDRDKVLFCCRNDLEKYYSDEEIDFLRKRIEHLIPTDITDTTIPVNFKKIRNNLKFYIESEIQLFAKYKLIITDRYHGTIFSLVANTPVIVIKTNDHKVTTGVEWFHGVYDEYVYLADSLENAFELAKMILNKDFNKFLEPYFDNEYYKNLKNIFDESIIKKRN